MKPALTASLFLVSISLLMAPLFQLVKVRSEALMEVRKHMLLTSSAQRLSNN